MSLITPDLYSNLNIDKRAINGLNHILVKHLSEVGLLVAKHRDFFLQNTDGSYSASRSETYLPLVQVLSGDSRVAEDIFSRPTFTLVDFACGQGTALQNLLVNLCTRSPESFLYKQKQIYAFDKVMPALIDELAERLETFPDYGFEVIMENQDILRPTRVQENKFDLGIVSYLLTTMNEEEYLQAILNAFSRCRYLFLAPFKRNRVGQQGPVLKEIETNGALLWENKGQIYCWELSYSIPQRNYF